MESAAVSSTTLASVAYDEARELELEFCSRAVYQYFGVPAEVHTGLLDSSSKGAYFNEVIRDRYPFVRVAERRG